LSHKVHAVSESATEQAPDDAEAILNAQDDAQWSTEIVF